jgi:hypothetical protein
LKAETEKSELSRYQNLLHYNIPVRLFSKFQRKKDALLQANTDPFFFDHKPTSGLLFHTPLHPPSPTGSCSTFDTQPSRAQTRKSKKGGGHRAL